MDRMKREGSNIWSTLLDDASATAATSVFASDKGVVVLGNDLSGKSVLVTKLQGLDDPHRGSALDFQVINVEDDELDENGICRLWIVDGDLAYRSLMRFALPKSMMNHSIVLLTVDMSQPWNIPETLDKWTSVLCEHIDNLHIESADWSNMKKKLVDDFLAYTDPSESKSESKLVLNKSLPDVMENDQLALSENIGIPMLVVCTKCDQLESLEAEYDYREEHFDYIQYHLRLFCLKHGAGLVFSSMKESKNIEVLKKYILHKLYGFPFDHPASVVDRDAVFVPIGWDSNKKINIIQESFTKFSVSDHFNTVISRPPTTRVFSHDVKEQIAEDEQAFLSRAQNVLSKAPVMNKAGASESPSLHGKLRSAQDGRVFNPVPVSKAKQDPAKAGANNEKMLANFFNSLLNKKPGSSPVANPQKSGRKSNEP